MTIIEKKVNGFGPYAYKVEYVGDGEQSWTYLGRADEVDTTDELEGLDPAEAGELLAHGALDTAEDGGYSAKDAETVEFGSLVEANAMRDQLPDEALAEDDDRRSKTLKLSPEASRSDRTRAAGAAADSRAHLADQHGQEDLTNAEKRELDFRRTNVMHARSAKAVLRGEGVDDWLAFYDPELTVDEHRELAETARHDEVGDRLDHQDTRAYEIQKQAEHYRTMERDYEDHARQACEEGHEEACDELRDLGWSEDEIEDLEMYARDAEDFARAVTDERRRSR